MHLLQKLKYPLLFFLFVVFFQEKFVTVYTALLVKPLLVTVKDSHVWMELILFLLTVSLWVWCGYKGRNGYRIPVTTVAWIIIGSILYAYFRLYNSSFHFIPMTTAPRLALTDFTFTLPAGLVIYWIAYTSVRFKAKKKQVAGSSHQLGFYTDLPVIMNQANDLFRRLSFVEELRDKILATQTNKASFAIGIIGPWGTGKTTFLHTLENLLERESEVLQFRFNAWAASNPARIIGLFFSDFSSALSVYDGTLKNELLNYAKLLLKSAEPNQLPFFFSLIKANEELPLEEQYKTINRSIEKLQKKIVIYIDDVDRLDHQEVVEVLRLVRNTANFSNTYFIVAFDRSYVLQSIRKVLPGETESYLEKIFQLEYYLPLTGQGELLENSFYQELMLILQPKEKAVVDKMRNVTLQFIGPNEIRPYLAPHLRHVRDVKRLLNVFNVNFNRIRHNIYLPDYITISLIRLRYPEVYKALYYKKSQFFTSTKPGEFFERETGELSLISNEKDGSKPESTVLYQELGNHNKYSIVTDDVPVVLNLIHSLFPPNTNYGTNQRTFSNHHLSISSTSCFERYFDFSLEGRLDETDFNEALQVDLATFKSKIEEWCSKRETATDLQIKLENLHTFTDRAQYEKVILGIIYYTNLEIPYNKGNFYTYNLENFLQKLGNLSIDENPILKIHYEENIQEFKSFISSLFTIDIRQGATYFLFQMGKHIITHSSSEFEDYALILSPEEVQDFLKERFLKALEQSVSFNGELLQHYSQIIRLYPTETHDDGKTIKPTGEGLVVTEKMKQFILDKGMKDFLNHLIFPCPNNHSMGYTLSNWYKVIFGGIDEFTVALDDSALEEERKEFYRFLRQIGDEECIENFCFIYLKSVHS